MAENIETVPAPAVSGTVCKLCLKVPSKYTCPRCQVQYCSSECYKSKTHAQCSELFYKDCFMEGLKEMKPEGKQQMMDILQRNAQAQQEEAEEDVEDLADRLEGVDLDGDPEAILECLTASEKAEFHSLVQSGDLGKLIEPWTAWWEKPTLVQDADAPYPHPQTLENIPKLSELIRVAVADSVKYSVVNVLYGYCYMCRLYNGDFDNSKEICAGFVKLSQGLGATRQFASTSDALHSCLLAVAETKSLRVSRPFSSAIMQDVIKLLGKTSWVAAAISDTHHLFTRAHKMVKKTLKKQPDNSKLKERKSLYFHILKKLTFLLAWCTENPQTLSELVPEIETEYCSVSSMLSAGKVQTPVKSVEKDNEKPLIEEI